MDLSICVALSASWRADFSRNGCRRRRVPGFCNLASSRLTLADDPIIMPTRVEFSTAVQHLTKALFLSKPARPPLTSGRTRFIYVIARPVPEPMSRIDVRCGSEVIPQFGQQRCG